MKYNMKNNNTTFYYLRINNKEIIKFTNDNRFSGMEDFYKLNVFTSSFYDMEELGNFLKEIGLVDVNTEIKSIDIVKRLQNKIGERKKTYQYVHVTSDIAYRPTKPFISVSSIRAYFSLNKNNYGLMTKFLEYYEYYQEKEMKNCNDKTGVYYNSCVKKLSNARRLSVLIEKLKNGDFSVASEYETRIYNLLDSELLYISQYGKPTSSSRGIVRMAIIISRVNKSFSKNKIETPKKSEFKVALKDYEEDEIDPDHYRFLEDEDFKGMLGENSSSELIESVDAQIENLADLKEKGTKRK